MTPAEVLIDAYGRVAENVEAVLDGLSEDDLAHRPGPDANPIAWLIWHLARVQDDHVASAAERPQLWTEEGYAERFGLPFDDGDIGYGQTTEQVAQVRVSGDLLLAYARAVHERSTAWIGGLAADDLDRIVDRNWDPPVTLGVRLVSVLDDCAQHVGQAAYVRGLLGR